MKGQVITTDYYACMNLEGKELAGDKSLCFYFGYLVCIYTIINGSFKVIQDTISASPQHNSGDRISTFFISHNCNLYYIFKEPDLLLIPAKLMNLTANIISKIITLTPPISSTETEST